MTERIRISPIHIKSSASRYPSVFDFSECKSPYEIFLKRSLDIMVSRKRLYSVSTSSDDEQKYDVRIYLQWCFPDFDCILTEVDQNEAKKEELIDIDMRILA